MNRLIFIVGRDRQDLYDAIVRIAEVSEPRGTVIFDRRQDRPHDSERDHPDRRMRPHADTEVRDHGWSRVAITASEVVGERNRRSASLAVGIEVVSRSSKNGSWRAWLSRVKIRAVAAAESVSKVLLVFGAMLFTGIFLYLPSRLADLWPVLPPVPSSLLARLIGKLGLPELRSDDLVTETWAQFFAAAAALILWLKYKRDNREAREGNRRGKDASPRIGRLLVSLRREREGYGR